MALEVTFGFTLKNQTDVDLNSQVSGGTIPYTYNWDFGDGKTSSQAALTHTYERGGAYLITLEVEDANGEKGSAYRFVFVQPDLVNITSHFLWDYVELKIPNFDTRKFDYSRRKWQAFLAPQVEGYDLSSEDDIFDEQKWPYLYNILIGELIVLDFIQDVYKGAVFSGSNNANSGTSNQLNAAGGLKSVKTGPSEVEYHDEFSYKMDFFSKLAANEGGEGNILDEYKNVICEFAGRLKVSLNMCNKGSKKILPQIYKKERFKNNIKPPFNYGFDY